MNWDSYNKRLNVYGDTVRERNINRLKQNILNKAPSNPSYKEIKLNGEDTYLVINTSTKPYYKEFESLPEQKVLAGDYIEWANNVWLVYEADCNDEIYTDGNLRQCQYELFWQNLDGKIISRYAWVQNASAYNNGESGNNTITLQSNQFMVYIPYDDDTLLLDNGFRIHMSRNNRKCKPYKLTRTDDIAFGYGKKGIMNIVFTQGEYNPNEDKLVELDNGTKVWICNYFSPITPPISPDETTDLSASINGNINLKIGYERTYTVAFKDLDGIVVDDVDFEWNVTSDFADKIKQTADSNKIKLMVEDDSLIGESFLLRVAVEGIVLSELTINVIEGF